MLIKDWMSKNVLTVDAKDALQKAVNVMKEHNVRLLPVMREGKLVGVISDRDVKRASTADAAYMEVQDVLYRSYKLKVEEVMSRDPVTVPDDFTVAEAADVLLQHKFSGLPVVDRKGQLVGIITQTDMFKVIVSMSGMAGRGIQFRLSPPGPCRQHQGSDRRDAQLRQGIASILSSYEMAPPDIARSTSVRSTSIAASCPSSSRR
ncbi:MAG: CBS domain-containing protein [Desulfobacterales bacterium]|nr:CBS domain-containing protein [Desulfobacterales bacterium]